MSVLRLKLHLDEHLSPRLAAQLRMYGFDVTSTSEVRLKQADDETQLAYSASEQRALVTFNHRDFVAIHADYIREGKEHWGLILSTEETTDVVSRRLLRLLNTLAPEDLKNQIRWLNEFR